MFNFLPNVSRIIAKLRDNLKPSYPERVGLVCFINLEFTNKKDASLCYKSWKW